MTSEKIFQPVATDEPPSVIPSRSDHPVPRLGIDQEAPIGTNKFYANFFLGMFNALSYMANSRRSQILDAFLL
jgi:endo-1,3(4)-beta-glucanase